MHAQETGPADAPPPEATADPGLQRPPEGIARGVYPVPAWVVVSIASLLVAVVVGFFLGRHLLARRRARRDRVHDSVAPPSSRH